MTIDEVNGFIEEKNGNKYWVFDSTDDKNKEILTKFAELWNRIKNKTESINEGENGEYKKNIMEIKFNSDDNLPLN